jgi:hypothetical protein
MDENMKILRKLNAKLKNDARLGWPRAGLHSVSIPSQYTDHKILNDR